MHPIGRLASMFRSHSGPRVELAPLSAAQIHEANIRYDEEVRADVREARRTPPVNLSPRQPSPPSQP